MCEAKLSLKLSVSFDLEFDDKLEAIRRLNQFGEAIKRTLPPEQSYEILRQVERAKNLIDVVELELTPPDELD